MNGRDRKFRVRSGDEFQHLEDLADQLRPIDVAAVAEAARLEAIKDIKEA